MSVHPSVNLYIHPSISSNRPIWQALRPLWQALGPLWQALRPIQPALRPLKLALRPLQLTPRTLQLALRPLLLALRPLLLAGETDGWMDGWTNRWLDGQKFTLFYRTNYYQSRCSATLCASDASSIESALEGEGIASDFRVWREIVFEFL